MRERRREKAETGRAQFQFDIFPGYDGLIPETSWFPVVCEVFNDGPPFNAVIEAASDSAGRGQTRLVPVGLVIVFGAAHGLPVLERGALAGACSRVAIFPAVLAFNLVGDGLRQALDPRLKQRGIV